MKRFVVLIVVLGLMAGGALAKSLDTINSNGLVFGTGASSPTMERMRITQDGKIGIGTPSPAAQLSVSGTIQVSGSPVTCDATMKGGLRYSNTSSTIEYCQGTAWVSVGPSGTSVPAFYVHKNGTSQSVSAGTTTLVTWSTEGFDTQNNFSGNRFQPTVAGKYIISLNMLCLGSTNYCIGHIYKNGVAYATSQSSHSGGVSLDKSVNVTAIVDLNGSTDYVEAYAYTNGTTIYGPTYFTNFSGSLLASGNGLAGGGGGSSDLAGLTDTNITNVAGRDYLRYDAGTSKWVNISESTVMSTTTMVSGWPDGIVCNISGPSYGKVTLYSALMPYSDGLYYYRGHFGGTALSVLFNSGGSFNSYQNATTTDCNKSIAQLYAAGQAFNFIGNSNVASTALGDRITSGTAPIGVIVNSATSYISLTNGATTWGYLGAGNSYLPALSSNNISSTGVVQVSGTSVTCNSGLKGAMRYSNTSSTIEYCQGSAWTSLGPSDTAVLDSLNTASSSGLGTTSACPTYVDIPGSSKSVSFPTPGLTAMSWNTGWFATTAGTSVLIRPCIGASCGTGMGFFPNEGLSHKQASGAWSTNVPAGTQTVKLQICRNAGSGTVSQDSGDSISWVTWRPGSGGSGGGGGSSDLAGLTDTNITNVAGRDYLRYDAGTSKWVNISESTVMSTTTMIPGWPDAIVCTMTNPNYGVVTFYPMHMPEPTSGLYYYRSVYTPTSTVYDLRFNANGSFNSYQGITTSNCGSKSIATLYAEGRAFNYIGGSSEGGSALGDRITSGTAPVGVIVNSATSYISLTNGATTWGYLQSAGSYLPTLSSTRVSSTLVSTSLIQVGTGNGATCNAGLAGSIRYNTTSATIDVCTGTGWTPMPSNTLLVGQQTISVVSATFGTNCPMPSPGNATTNLSNACNGQTTCNVTMNAANATGGVDPCSGTSKQWAVSYSCGITTKSTTGNENGTAALSCAGYTVSVTTSAQGATGDVQFNNAGAFAADTGKFTYASGVLSAPGISSTNISASGVVQVSGSSLTCGANLKGAMRYSNTSSTIEYCQGTAWVSVGPSATNVPAFFVHKNGTNQTVSSAVDTKLTWSTEVFDTRNNFSGDRFTPNVAGKYIFVGRAFCQDATNWCHVAIYKNGSSVAIGNSWNSTGNLITTTGAVILDMNGTTDYVELWAKNGGGTIINGAVDTTNFSGSLLSSGNGVGSAAPAGSAGDIQFNSGGGLAADTGQLYWDATNNRLGVGTSSPNASMELKSASTGGGLRVDAGSGSNAFVDFAENGVLKSNVYWDGAIDKLLINTLSQGDTIMNPSSGRVGIGTLSPLSVLDVNGWVRFNDNQEWSGLTLQNSYGSASLDSNNYIDFRNENGVPTSGVFNFVSSGGASTIGLWTTPAGSRASDRRVERLRITSTGSVGIGLWNPSYMLQVTGQVAGGGAYVNTSDARLKKDVEDLNYGLATIMKLRPVSFWWKDQKEDWQKGRHLGLIAQEAEKVVPEVVSTANDPSATKSIAYGDLTPILLKGMQELKAANDNAVSRTLVVEHELKVVKAENAELRRALKAANDNMAMMRKDVDRMLRASR